MGGAVLNRQQLADGITEVTYVTGKGITGKKTVYDPAMYTDQKMLEMSVQATNQAWRGYITSGSKTLNSVIEGVPFRTIWAYDPTGNLTLYSHPGKK
jgi:hypothetical protein